MKVNFLIIGAAKSATTSLSYALSQHPDISFSHPKEPQFFSKTDWRQHIDAYHALFKKKAKLYGEGSTNYTKFPAFNKNIYQDIYEYNPNMKFIYIMRHPIDRIVSQYIHTYNRGYETLKNIDQAIMSNSHYTDISQYAMQIEPYIKLFGRENVLLLFFEDFTSKPQSVAEMVFDFLNIEPIAINTHITNSNKSFNRRVLHHKFDNPKTLVEKLKKVTYIIRNYFNPDFIAIKPQLSETTKEHVLRTIKRDILKIEKLTNRDLSHWLTP